MFFYTTVMHPSGKITLLRILRVLFYVGNQTHIEAQMKVKSIPRIESPYARSMKHWRKKSSTIYPTEACDKLKFNKIEIALR